MEGSDLPAEPTVYLLRLGTALFLVAANGFFVAAEFALVKVRATRIGTLAEAGNRRARVAEHILQRLDYYLSACQFGITVTSLTLGWLAEPAVAELLLVGVRWMGWGTTINPALSHAVALVAALSLLTALQITTGEQAPKILAIRRSEATALAVAYPLRAFAAVFRPFIWLINEASAALLRLVGLGGAGPGEPSADVAEIRNILLASAQSGHISPRQQQLAENVLHLVDLEVRHILVPRVDVEILSTERSLEDNLAVLAHSSHTRWPLCDGDLDAVIGVVHVKDVLGNKMRGQDVDLAKLARKPVFVSETQSLSRLIATMQRERAHIAFALDEHGSVIGTAFLEDALEQVVGTIRDEFDEAPPQVERQDDGTYRVPGSLALPEAVSLLQLPPLDDAVDTIGGYVVAELGRLPQRGDSLQIGGYTVTVSSVSRRRIEWLRFEPQAQESGA